jgi:hypothetical protein
MNYPGNTTPQNPDDAELTLKKILLALIGGGPGGAIPVNPSGGGTVGTYTYFHVANSGSLAGGIPTTAKRWAVNFMGTGTGNTFGSNTALTGGQGFDDDAAPASAIAIACDGSTVADGFYSTT